MSEDNAEKTDKIPFGCPSPARLEKTDSSSSRQSGSPVHWDFDSGNRTGRIRPSSWDDSDDDLSPKPETSASNASRIYSSESKAFRGSISSEINELKKQFFQSLQKENPGNNDSLRLETLKEKLELKFKYDRRQSPARVRRRSRSSSSSSPVPETQNSPETKDKGTGPELELDDSDGMSPRTLEMDSRYYLNNFFSELRAKRISMLDSFPMTDKVGKDDMLICDNLKLEMLSQLNAPDLNDDDGHFCKTSRKLSQILEVEENRKDLEKSSEESLEKSGLVISQMGDSSPPLQTARSKRSGKVEQTAGDGRQRKGEGGYRSLSFEEFCSFQKVGKPSRGSLSERSARIFESKIDDDFIHLCAKTGKTHLSSPKVTEGQDMEKSFQFLCFAGALGANRNFSAEPSSREEDAEKNSKTCEYPNAEATPGSPSSRKSTDRSEQSHTSRTRSGQSRRSGERQSPRFALSIGGESARNLRVDDVNTSRSQSKGGESRKMSQSKRSSSEDCSGRNSNKSSFRSEGTCESKRDQSLYIRLDSPSLESLKSSRSFSGHRTTRNNSRSRPSTQRSQRSGKGGSNREADVEPTPRTQNLVLENCKNSPAGSSRSREKADNASCRSDSSKKTPKSPRTVEDGFSSRASGSRTPRSPKIHDLGLLLEIVGRAESEKALCRNPEVAESDDGVKDTDQSRSSTDRPSDRSFGSRSRSGRFRKSTPRSRSATPQTIGSNSVRSRDEGQPRLTFSEEFESVCDTLSNRTPISAATRKNSCRETDVPSQQPSCRSENSAARRSFTPVPDNSIEGRPFGSRKSPMRDKPSPRSPGNISLGKSERLKSRPASWTSAESKCTDVLPGTEKPDTDVRSGRSTNRSLASDKYEEKEEYHSSPGSKSGTESDRQSNKRLSIINEVTFEDLENTAIPAENEEKDFWEKSRPPTRRSRKGGSSRSVRTSPKDATVASGESFRGKSSDDSTPRIRPPDGGTWTELIQTFEQSQNSSVLSEKIFPGFPSQKEGDSVRLSVYPSATETLEKLCDDDVNLEDSFELSRKDRTPKSGRKQILEKASDQQCKKDFGFGLVYKDSLMEKMKVEEERPPLSPQNLFYVDVDKGGSFGIGEFGDITWWSGGKSDLQDLDKPKDHGDGMHSFKSSEILLKPEKRDKEMKNQRQLWTDLRDDFRDSRLFSSDRFPGVQSDRSGFIPVGLRASKSDNCITRKSKEESESQSSAIYEFLSESKERENIQDEFLENRERDEKPAPGNMVDPFGSGSVDSGKEESETAEFDDRTPRLSRSMSDLLARLPLERSRSDGLSESYNSSTRAQLFEKPDSGEKEKKELVNLDIFLARKREGEFGVKSNNWLHLKSTDRKKSVKREKKSKIKMKKEFNLSREPYVEYLTSRKSQPSMSGLKQRNVNCFQSFYKRFISVFCVTSNSSAATSK